MSTILACISGVTGFVATAYVCRIIFGPLRPYDRLTPLIQSPICIMGGIMTGVVVYNKLNRN